MALGAVASAAVGNLKVYMLQTDSHGYRFSVLIVLSHALESSPVSCNSRCDEVDSQLSSFHSSLEAALEV